MNKDKNLSGTLIFLTLGFILYVVGSDGGTSIQGSLTVKEIILNIFESYLDIVIIIYVFWLCN